MLAWLSTVIAVSAYATATILLLVRLIRRTASPLAVDRIRGLALGIGLAGTAVHGLALGLLSRHPEGLDLGLGNVLSLVGLVIALVILLAAFRQRVLNLAIPLLPIAALTAVLAKVMETPAPLTEPTPILVTHVLLSLAAYSVLSVAVVLSLVLGFQERRLRRHRPGGMLRILPPLEITERLLFQLITVGFIGLTLALFSGLFFVEDLFDQHLVHKTVLSICAWVLFGTLLWGRRKFGWRGRTAIRWSLIAFVVLALAYFGSRIALEVILGRSWG